MFRDGRGLSNVLWYAFVHLQIKERTDEEIDVGGGGCVLLILKVYWQQMAVDSGGQVLFIVRVYWQVLTVDMEGRGSENMGGQNLVGVCVWITLLSCAMTAESKHKCYIMVKLHTHVYIPKYNQCRTFVKNAWKSPLHSNVVGRCLSGRILHFPTSFN